MIQYTKNLVQGLPLFFCYLFVLSLLFLLMFCYIFGDFLKQRKSGARILNSGRGLSAHGPWNPFRGQLDFVIKPRFLKTRSPLNVSLELVLRP